MLPLSDELADAVLGALIKHGPPRLRDALQTLPDEGPGSPLWVLKEDIAKVLDATLRSRASGGRRDAH